MILSPQSDAVLFFAGVAASILGSIVGLGGGFVVLPTMLVLFSASPQVASGTSLVFVVANVLGATIGYLRQGVIDLRLGGTIAIGAIPASIAGVLILRSFTPIGFDVAYGTMLVGLGILTLRRRAMVPPDGSDQAPFARSVPLAIGAGVLIGFSSSIFGIGGGFVMVPVFLVLARMRPHVVAATSSFVILLTAPFGVAAHAVAGHISLAFAIPLVAGGLVGGTIGPQIARRLSGPGLITLLVWVLFGAAALLVARHLF